VACGGQHQAGEALMGGAVGADQIAQVGAGRDEQQLDVEIGRDLPGPADAVGIEVKMTPGCHALQRIRASSPGVTAPAPLMLLDAASMYFRAYYGVPESITAPDGTPVNAVRG